MINLSDESTERCHNTVKSSKPGGLISHLILEEVQQRPERRRRRRTRPNRLIDVLHGDEVIVGQVDVGDRTFAGLLDLLLDEAIA